jgi:hypothetical protein
MNRILRTLLAVSACAATSAGLAAGAQAAEPQRQTVVLDRVIPAQHPCAGFVVDARYHLVREITTWSDGSGTPTRQIIHVTVDGVLTNSVTGESVTSKGVRVFHSDLLTGALFTTGSNTIIHEPGGGAITLGTGLLEFGPGGVIVDYHGPTDAAEYQALCDLLG